MALDVKIDEHEETSDPTISAVLDAKVAGSEKARWIFSFSEEWMDKFLESLESLRDKGKDFNNYARIQLVGKAKFNKPTKNERWDLAELDLSEVIEATRLYLYKKMGFSEKSPQKRLE